MKKEKTYRLTHFSTKAIEEVLKKLWTDEEQKQLSCLMRVEHVGEEWTYSEIKEIHEFLSDYSSSNQYASFNVRKGEKALDLRRWQNRSVIEIAAESRGEIQEAFLIFEKHTESSRIPEPPKIDSLPNIFIGHGRSNDWKELKDHLHEQHHYPVTAYETDIRAGHEIRDILEEMLDKSSFAIIVMTAEDEQRSGEMRPRQNVVHEAGLFQGRLGFKKVILLVEEGVETFSNIQSIHQIRFKKESIRSTFGDVLATLKREKN